jgi:hypothetical protein
MDWAIGAMSATAAPPARHLVKLLAARAIPAYPGDMSTSRVLVVLLNPVKIVSLVPCLLVVRWILFRTEHASSAKKHDATQHRDRRLVV